MTEWVGGDDGTGGKLLPLSPRNGRATNRLSPLPFPVLFSPASQSVVPVNNPCRTRAALGGASGATLRCARMSVLP